MSDMVVMVWEKTGTGSKKMEAGLWYELFVG